MGSIRLTAYFACFLNQAVLNVPVNVCVIN